MTMTHLGPVQLGHFNTADATTEIDNAAPAGGDGRALHVRASLPAGGVGAKAVGYGQYGTGVLGYSYDDVGVYGIALPFSGNATNGVTGASANPAASGVYGTNSGGGYGVAGRSSSIGVFGESTQGGVGVYGNSPGGPAVYGVSYGGGSSGTGVVGLSDDGTGVYGFSSSGLAGRFNGNVDVAGTLTKGAGAFKIDHPLDPTNKYLWHSLVESPDMKTIYDGVVMLDDDGSAVVGLPAWFEALNRDFRYQLTPLGGPAPNLHISEGVRENRFSIAGGLAHMNVSWQVTGIRHDPYAEQHRIPVEEQKSDEHRGMFIHPVEYNQPQAMGIAHQTATQWEDSLAALRGRAATMAESHEAISQHHLTLEQRENESQGGAGQS
jgi:hypothetical protein